jgi:MYXO-CTERM domain-containing protein
LDFTNFSFNPLYPREGTKSRVVDVTDDQGKTSVIPITGVTLNKDGSIASFTLAGPNWYPPKDNSIKLITDKGITGSINLDTGMVSFVAKYIFDPSETGAINIYTVTGMIEKPGPGPGATPLPSTWAMMLSGLAALGFVAYRRQKQAPGFSTA